jgi:signal transduction histidine kinase
VCEIIVEDNGMGFDEKHVDRVFKPFQRLHGRTEYEGTGMGLAICRKIVDRHGGIITVRPVPGEGARFIINLPIRQEKRDAGPLGLTSRPRPPDPAT